ncbi:MAG: STAS domain-containing protein [bacterium]
MEINVRESKGHTVMDVTGEVMFMDTQTFIERARELVERNPGGSFVFNFTDCPHLGTLALGTLREIHIKVHARGRKLKILSLNETGRFRMEEIPVEPPFSFVESEDEI